VAVEAAVAAVLVVLAAELREEHRPAERPQLRVLHLRQAEHQLLQLLSRSQ
jgi:hypothetical protein